MPLTWKGDIAAAGLDCIDYMLALVCEGKDLRVVLPCEGTEVLYGFVGLLLAFGSRVFGRGFYSTSDGLPVQRVKRDRRCIVFNMNGTALQALELSLEPAWQLQMLACLLACLPACLSICLAVWLL